MHTCRQDTNLGSAVVSTSSVSGFQPSIKFETAVVLLVVLRAHLRRKKPLKRKNNGQNNGNTETLMSEEIATSKGRCTIIRST